MRKRFQMLDPWDRLYVQSGRCSVDAPSVHKLGRFLCAERLVNINILRHQILRAEEETIFKNHHTFLLPFIDAKGETDQEIQTKTNSRGRAGLITITHQVSGTSHKNSVTTNDRPSVMGRVFAPQAAPWELVSGLCWPGSRSCSLSRQRQVLRCHGVWMMLTSVNSRSIMSELGIIDPWDAAGEYSAQARPQRRKARLSSASHLSCELSSAPSAI